MSKEQLYHYNDTIDQLQQENKILRETLNNLKGDKASEHLVNAVNAVYEPLLQDKFDEIERLKKELKQSKEKLAEKDKEIKEEKEITIELVAKCKTFINEKYDLEYKHIMLRHEICEKIRERVVNGGFCSTVKEFADGIYEKYKNWVFDILDQIEGEK